MADQTMHETARREIGRTQRYLENLNDLFLPGQPPDKAQHIAEVVVAARTMIEWATLYRYCAQRYVFPTLSDEERTILSLRQPANGGKATTYREIVRQIERSEYGVKMRESRARHKLRTLLRAVSAAQDDQVFIPKHAWDTLKEWAHLLQTSQIGHRLLARPEMSDENHPS